MFQPVIDASQVQKAYTVPLQGATDAIQFYDQLSTKRRREDAQLAKESRADQMKAASSMRLLATKHIGTGTPVDPILNQRLPQQLAQVKSLLKTDPVAAMTAANEAAAQNQSDMEWATGLKKDIREQVAHAYQQNPSIDQNALYNQLAQQTFADGNGGLNYNASTTNWGNIDPQQALSVYPYTNRAAVEKGIPAYLEQRFPKGKQTIYEDPATGQPFYDAAGRQVGKDITAAPYQGYSPQRGFYTQNDPQAVEGDPLVSPQQMAMMNMAGGALGQTREQLGQVPLLPEEHTNAIASDMNGQLALLHKIDDIKEHPTRYFGEGGEKIVKHLDDNSLMRYAGYQLVNTHGPKGGNEVKDNSDIAEYLHKRQRENVEDMFRSRSDARAAQSNAIQLAKFNKENEDAQFTTTDASGKAHVIQIPGTNRPATNKEVKETKAALQSVPGMWLSAMGGHGAAAQTEAISHMPAPVELPVMDVLGSSKAKWIPISAQATGKGDYLTDPITQAPVSIYFDPLFKDDKGRTGRVAVVPMKAESIQEGGKQKYTGNYLPDGNKGRFYSGADLADFMHTYAPQAIKGAAVSYERLAPFVNQAFNTNAPK